MNRKRKKFLSDPYLVTALTMVPSLVVIAILNFADPFSATEALTDKEFYIVRDDSAEREIALDLKDLGIIKSTWAFRLALDKSVKPGGYYLSGDMNILEITRTLENQPELIRLTIPEGWRKEQTAELLAEELNWSLEEKQRWLTEDTEAAPEEREGVYFPDTYLIPRDEPPSRTSRRLRNRFNEILQPYMGSALQKNIQWTTLVTLASIIEREASGEGDRSLISGILWNRLERGMKLDTDCTVQYIRDTLQNDNRWWEPLDPRDKQIDSLFNTYKYKGLPPSPINSPGRAALEAALNPAVTDFLYYLHDDRGVIHCARTYEEHLDNIQRHLRNDRG